MRSIGVVALGLRLLSISACTSLSVSNPSKVRMSNDSIRIDAAPKSFRRIILENEHLWISFLPELGGRIYEFVEKQSGWNRFYKNTTWKWTGWGMNSCRPKGGWKAIGGIEFSFPENEHGCVHDLPFESRTEITSGGTGKVTLWRKADEHSRGLELQIEVRLSPGKRYFQVTSAIKNPQKTTVQLQYWINAMLTTHSKDPRNANVEFIFPPETKSMNLHGWGGNKSDFPELKPKMPFPWPKYFHFYDLFKDKGAVGFFASKPIRYQAVFSHTNREGTVRIFKSSQGAKVLR